MATLSRFLSLSLFVSRVGLSPRVQTSKCCGCFSLLAAATQNLSISSCVSVFLFFFGLLIRLLWLFVVRWWIPILYVFLAMEEGKIIIKFRCQKREREIGTHHDGGWLGVTAPPHVMWVFLPSIL